MSKLVKRYMIILLLSHVACILISGCDTPMHQTTRPEQAEKQQISLQKHIDVKARDKDGKTPLHNAVIGAQLKLAEKLLSEGADVNATDKERMTPLHYATIHKEAQIINWIGPYLFEAVTHRDKELIDLLLRKGADVNVKNNSGGMPLHNACVNGDKEVVELLLAHGADVNAMTNDGKTPLHCVAESDYSMNLSDGGKIIIKGNKEIAQLLLDKGADPNSKDKNGSTPLQVAARQGHKDLADLLKRAQEVQMESIMDTTHGLSPDKSKPRVENQASLSQTTSQLEALLKEKPDQVLRYSDHEAKVYEPDGKIILIDSQAGDVFLNVGTDDHVCLGLTFSVYDRNTTISKDTKAKATVEVFSVTKGASKARVKHRAQTSPITAGDIVVNLIWDREQTNEIVIAGEFDLDNDGDIEEDAIDKLKAIIKNWGGTVSSTLSSETDFIILGSKPEIPGEQDLPGSEVNTIAKARHDERLTRMHNYEEIQKEAQTLQIPIFDFESVCRFIGWE